MADLKAHLSYKEISFIIGPRQAGKTTLMLFLKDYLEKKGERVVFFNLDIERDKQFFASQGRLIRKIQLEIGERKGFVFIDEIQRREDAGIFLKGIYDMDLPYKFIVSGSGSVELKEKIHESLVGRKRVFMLPVLTFAEFVNFRTNYKYEDRLLEFFSLEKVKAKEFLEEYLIFGGYPRLVLEETREEKQKIIDEIYQSYLERDISYLLKVKKTEAFSELVKLMAGQTGCLANFSELSATLGISVQTVKDYLWYLEKTFILQRIAPYFRNLRKEITKSPVFYFYDLGLRNYSVGTFGSLETQRAGFLFQNLVFNNLKQRLGRTAAKIYFWRTKEGAEVDFVVGLGQEVLPIEVKYQELKKPVVTRSMRSFIGKYKPKKAFIVNLTLEESLTLNKTKVCFIPFYRLCSSRCRDRSLNLRFI